MAFDAAITDALLGWGAKHQLTDIERTPSCAIGGEEVVLWNARSVHGSLTLRYTSLLARRALGPRLIEELERHQVGRRIRIGSWYANALTSGHDVFLTFRETVSMELAVAEQHAPRW